MGFKFLTPIGAAGTRRLQGVELYLLRAPTKAMGLGVLGFQGFRVWGFRDSGFRGLGFRV